MSCICKLQSKANTHKEYIHGDEESDLSVSIDRLNIDDDKYIRTGYGIVINFNDKSYVITCYHILNTLALEYCHVDTSSGSDKSFFNMDCVLDMKEMDVAILTYNNDTYNTSGINLDEYLHDVNNDLFNLRLKLDNKTIKVTKAMLDNGKVRSRLFPEIPIIRISIEDTDIDLHGLSGSILYNDHNPLGMVVSTTAHEGYTIECIYLPFIVLLMASYLTNKTPVSSGIIIDSTPCEIEDDTGKEMTAHYIVRDSRSYGMSDGKFNFKEGDVIVKINNTEFQSDGMVSCKKLGLSISVPINTYILLLSSMFNTINLQIFRETSIKEYRIYPLPYNSIFANRITDSGKRVSWKGFNFTELSEDMLIMYGSKGITFSGPLIKDIDSYGIDSNIVLCDIDTSKAPSAFKKFSLPIRGNKGNYYILKLDKVGQKRIHDLDELGKILKGYKKKAATLTFSIDTDDADINKELKFAI
jgi:hypothetical protein